MNTPRNHDVSRPGDDPGHGSISGHKCPFASAPRSRGSITVHPLASDLVGPAGVTVDDALINLLDASIIRMTARGDELARVFYRRLFDVHPNLRPMFPSNLAAQQTRLLDTLRFVTHTLRAPTEVRDRLRRLGEFHRGRHVRPEHYPIVCEGLLAAMAEISGRDWTPTLEAEWRRALQQISIIMIKGAIAAPPSNRGATPPTITPSS
jgi:nitric oxide dioxygenase